MRNHKKLLATGLALVVVVAGGAGAASASDTRTSPEAIANSTLGHSTRSMTSSVSTNGVTVAKARANGQVRSLVADVDGGKAIVAVLESGNEARFDLALPEGAELEQQPDGNILVATKTDEAVSIQAVVQAPWAKDATGRTLPTSYSVEGNTLVQHVDTTGAQYPVVADPWIAGWGSAWGALVVYVQWSKSETHSLAHSALTQGVATAAGVACGEIPYWPAKVICAGLVVWKYAEFNSAVTYASDHNRCLKARVPYTGSFLYAFTFYSVPC